LSRKKPGAPIVPEQQAYYRQLLERHGDDPRAVGYNDVPTQHERYARLARLFDGAPEPFTVHEIGCGLGHFGSYLAQHRPRARYSGSDVVAEFVTACRAKFPGATFHERDVTAELPAERYDFVTMSGTLNGRLGRSEEEWHAFSTALLEAMFAMCRLGLAANFLSAYADPERMRPELHYADPRATLEFATRRLSRHVEIDAGGPLYEFTLRVYRPEFLRARYPAPEFDRYFG
jgi:SAM-dependent methyltransferase